MRRRVRTAIALLALVLLALPATTLAQSAGDEQYADPFGPVEKAPRDAQQPPADDGAEAPAAPAPAPAPAAESAQAAPAAESAQAPATLPRTGFPAALALAAGWWMLLGGAALRRVA